MTFNIAEFFHANRLIFIWASFFGLLYLMLMHGLFGLVFVTYILCFLFHGPIDWLDAKTPLPRWFWTTLIYSLFVALIL
ncbi:MAG: AI-2E family transporter, partial [Desulfovibrio sp.]